MWFINAIVIIAIMYYLIIVIMTNLYLTYINIQKKLELNYFAQNIEVF